MVLHFQLPVPLVHDVRAQLPHVLHQSLGSKWVHRQGRCVAIILYYALMCWTMMPVQAPCPHQFQLPLWQAGPPQTEPGIGHKGHVSKGALILCTGHAVGS